MAAPTFTALTHKKRKYMEAVVAGKTKQEAKRIAGYCATTSTSVIETTSVKAAFSRLVRQYVPAHKLAQRVAEGVDATKTIVVMGGKNEPATTQEIADFKERREYAKLAAEFGGYVEPDGKSPDVSVQVGFTLVNNITKPKGDTR